MLKAHSYGDVTRFDLGRTLFGRGRYWATAYLIHGTMIDTGCAFSAPELVEALADVPLTRIVNTHSHEDHIGGNGGTGWKSWPIHSPCPCSPIHAAGSHCIPTGA
jgi:glyoxylase-like metal-dependent hydrolase (beta-lactamase superfamily II)